MIMPGMVHKAVVDSMVEGGQLRGFLETPSA